MPVFIDNLTFYGDNVSVNSAEAEIIVGSLIPGNSDYVILRFTSKENSLIKN